MTDSSADYPAAHSMDTYWFAMDEAGEVAYFETWENGEAPEGLKAVSGFDDFLDRCEKDPYGVTILPSEEAPFPDGESLSDLERILAGLSASQVDALQQAASKKTGAFSFENRRALQLAIGLGRGSFFVRLVDAAEVKLVKDGEEDERYYSLYRIDPHCPIYYASVSYAKMLCLFLKKRLAAVRDLTGVNDDFLGVHHYESEEYDAREYGAIPELRFPPEYRRKFSPQRPRTLWPARILEAQLISSSWPVTAPLVHRLSGIRFAETAKFWMGEHLPPLNPEYNRFRRDVVGLFNNDPRIRKQYLQHWLAAAEEDKSEAQYWLGLFYQDGPEPDPINALYWFDRAARLTEADGANYGAAAQCKLAEYHERGIATPQDEAEALRWYEIAANNGNSRAQCRLGEMYLEGRGVAADHHQARFWLLRADLWDVRHLLPKVRSLSEAEQGNPLAQYLEGYCEKDEERANTWYWKSAERGYAPAQMKLAWLNLEQGKDEKHVRRAQEWFAKAGDAAWADRLAGALNGEIRAMLELAKWFDGKSSHSAPDVLNSIFWYLKVAEYDQPVTEDERGIVATAQFCLAVKYERGRHKLPDLQNQALAQHWYQKSAANGFVEALRHLEK